MDEATVVILNELLVSEQRSLASRLFDSTLFVSRLSLPAQAIFRRMAEAARDHGAALTELIRDLGGMPDPRSSDASTADLHFLELHYVLPRLAADQERLVRKYVLAAQRVPRESRGVGLITRILERHQEDLKRLRELQTLPRPMVG